MMLITAIITTPPIHSAAANCQPIKSRMITPSSSTRLVAANRKAIAVTSDAPFLNSVRITAAAA